MSERTKAAETLLAVQQAWRRRFPAPTRYESCENRRPHQGHWEKYPVVYCQGVPKIENWSRMTAWNEGHSAACSGLDDEGGWCGHFNPYTCRKDIEKARQKAADLEFDGYNEIGAMG